MASRAETWRDLETAARREVLRGVTLLGGVLLSVIMGCLLGVDCELCGFQNRFSVPSPTVLCLYKVFNRVNRACGRVNALMRWGLDPRFCRV